MNKSGKVLLIFKFIMKKKKEHYKKAIYHFILGEKWGAFFIFSNQNPFFSLYFRNFSQI